VVAGVSPLKNGCNAFLPYSYAALCTEDVALHRWPAMADTAVLPGTTHSPGTTADATRFPCLTVQLWNEVQSSTMLRFTIQNDAQGSAQLL
jgi:hypothetical protein